MEDGLFDNSILGIVLSNGFTFVMIVVSLAASYFLFRWLRKSYDSGTVQNGVSAPATILRMWDTGTTVNNDPMVRFSLEVIPPDGQAFQVECKQSISHLEMGAFTAGASVTVFYDPTNHKMIHITAMNAAAVPQYGMPTPQSDMNQADMDQNLVKLDADNEAIIGRGQSAPAEVLGYTEWNVKIDGENPVVTLQLRVSPPGKPQFMAEASGFISVASVPKFQPGKTIYVKFDPYNLTQVAIDHS